MKEDELAGFGDNVGIIFQAFRLIPSMTALQNVAVPMELAGNSNAQDIAVQALEKVGLGHRLNHLPDQLRRETRVAIARAIAPKPHVYLQMSQQE